MFTIIDRALFLGENHIVPTLFKKKYIYNVIYIILNKGQLTLF